MMIPFLAILIGNECLDKMFDPISNVLHIAEEYKLHTGMFVKKIRFRSTIYETSVITVTDSTYIGMMNDSYVFNISDCANVISKRRFNSYIDANKAYIRCLEDNTFPQMKITQNGKYIYGSRRIAGDCEIDFNGHIIEYIEI